jgi:protein MPE1
MSSIHYKFKSAKDYDTYRFEGAGIPVWDLKNEIIRAKKLEKSQDFDLVISNAQTNEGINLIQVTARS